MVGLIFQTFVLLSEDVLVGSRTHSLEVAELLRQGSHVRGTESSEAQRLVHFQGQRSRRDVSVIINEGVIVRSGRESLNVAFALSDVVHPHFENREGLHPPLLVCLVSGLNNIETLRRLLFLEVFQSSRLELVRVEIHLLTKIKQNRTFKGVRFGTVALFEELLDLFFRLLSPLGPLLMERMR